VSGQKPREIALHVVSNGPGGEFIEERLQEGLRRQPLPAADRALCQELAYGVVRWQATLDYLIDRKLRTKPPDKRVRQLLRLGLYQLFWLSRIPAHAAVHETVELAKRWGSGAQPGFVNAVLRGYVREDEETRQLLAKLKVTQRAVGYSHPGWLVERWEGVWGAEATRQLMEWNNLPPKTFARVNCLKADPKQLLGRWKAEGVEYQAVERPWLSGDSVFELTAHPALDRLPSFQEGWFYVQDPSTLLAVGQLGPEPGERVLDLCAAPGGKLTYIAELMQNQGRLVAQDTRRERLALVEENCARLGIKCVQAILSSGLTRAGSSRPAAREESKSARGETEFDRILIDAPCSNTGVMRRRVELRWRIRAEEIQRLREGQMALLVQAAPLLRPGGVLVYSTCSLEAEENGAVVTEFLKGTPRFELESSRELLPFVDEVDGAYVARLRRRG
jgi:16S rRNA (cytosine967-C5)-methyltransferase